MEDRAGSIVAVGYELTGHTRAGLMDNILSLTLAHPIPRMAAEAVAQMLRDCRAGDAPGKRLLTFDIFCPENV